MKKTTDFLPNLKKFDLYCFLLEQKVDLCGFLLDQKFDSLDSYGTAKVIELQLKQYQE